MYIGLRAWCPLDEGKYPDSFHYDWKLANHTIELLKYVQNKGGPWFVAAGFRRPHVINCTNTIHNRQWI